jgi:hypothetical protein
LLGYPDAALTDAEHALTHAREIGQAASLMYALSLGLFARYECGNYANATTAADELGALAEKRSCAQSPLGSASIVIFSCKFNGWRNRGS